MPLLRILRTSQGARRAAYLLALLAWPALAQAPLEGPLLRGTRVRIHAGSGDQTDAHVSGDWVVYSSELDGGSELRYHNLVTGEDNALPGAGGVDFASDFHGSTILYTHLGPSGSSVYTFDLAQGSPPAELAPQGGINRREPVMGGRIVVWQDFDLAHGLLQPELVIYDLSSHSVTRLTSDTLLDKDPAVSPDGSVIVWTKCETDGTGCTIWRALNAGGGWVSSPLTDLPEAGSPDTNGHLVVYHARAPAADGGMRAIFWQPVAGGDEQALLMPGESRNPVMSHRLIAFEHRDPSAPVPNWDIYLYDLAARTLYRLTDTPVDEALSDLAVLPDGTVRVAWQSGAADYDVEVLSFHLDTYRCAQAVPPPGCDAAGGAQLLATVELKADAAHPGSQEGSFRSARGRGLLCVDRPEGGSLSQAHLSLNGPGEPWEKVLAGATASVQSPVMLQGANVLRLSGRSRFRARVFGPPPPCPEGDAEAASVHGQLGTPVGFRGRLVPAVDGKWHLATPPDAPHPVSGCTGGSNGGAWAWLFGLAGGGLPRRRRAPRQPRADVG